jgi:hypothetical protein
MRGILGVLVAAVVAGGVVAEPADAKRPSREFFGIVPQTVIEAKDLEQMNHAGIGTMRYMFFWAAIEASPGTYDWSHHDALIREATARGIRIFPTLYGTPGWANMFGGVNGCGGCAPSTDATRDAFANFARAAVARYGPGGEFWTPRGGYCGAPALCPYQPAPCGCTQPLPIHSWQVWNEQNSPKYYKPTPSPNVYAKLVATAGPAIKSVDPTADVVLGGMWGPPDTDAVIPTAEYLERIYSVPGIEGAFDSIAVHPYSTNLSGMKSQMLDARAVVKRAGDTGVGTWVTELGWASGGPRNDSLVKTPKAQARLLTESYEYLLEKRRAWKIRGITWYAWRDAPPEQTDCAWCPQSGLRNINGAGKPAMRAFRRLSLGKG